MKLDADLMRELLLKIEEGYPSRSSALTFPLIDGKSEDDVAYHCLLAWEAGLLDAIDVTSMGNHFKMMSPRRLTYDGHQFVEKVRDPELWAKTKDGARKIGSFGLDTIAKLAVGFIETEIKKRTGYELNV